MEDYDPLPDHLHSRAFTRQEALRAGVPVGAFRSRYLRRHFHGVYSSLAQPHTPELHATAALLAVRGPGMIAGASALQLYGLEMPLDWHDDHLVHVQRTHPASHRGPRGIEVTNPRREHPSLVHPVRRDLVLATPVEAWLQFAEAGATVYQLIVIGDGLLRRRKPLALPDDLRRAVTAAGPVQGIGNLRRALELIRPRTDSSMETHVRLLVTVHGLPEPTVNHPVRLASLGFEASTDLAYVKRRIAVEYDGDGHRDRRQWRADGERTRALEALGWTVIRANGTVIAQPMPFLADLQEALVRRGWDGIRRPPPITAEELALPGRHPW